MCAIWLLATVSFTFASIVDATCSENCLPPTNGTITTNGTESTNGTVACNETTTECLYGCQEGFEGPLCDIESVMNSTNCTLASDNENCLPPPNGTVLCNETTKECLFGCQEGFVGLLCDIACVTNCTNCTLDFDDPTRATCHECERDYFRSKGQCERCNGQCLQNASSALPLCREAEDGRCEFGCEDGYHGLTCNNTCSATCLNNTCDQITGRCENGCTNDTLTGHFCDLFCNEGCVNGTCDQNGQCLLGCKPGYWDKACNRTCNPNCTDAPNQETTQCDPSDGTCLFGCLSDTRWGLQCSLACSDFCNDSLCNQTTGACSDGCAEENMLTEECSKNCSVNCKYGTCLKTNGTCLYGCQNGFVGPLCHVFCDIRNCVNCTLDTVDPTKSFCNECEKDYYRGEGKCNVCNRQCNDSPNSSLPKCKEADGRCEFGCKNTYHGLTCNNPCSATCKNRTCDQINGRCVKGCLRETLTGPYCYDRCNPSCVNGTCAQDGQCPGGCQVGYWGKKCITSCNTNCTEAPNQETTQCDPSDGRCMFGCLNNTSWSQQCSKKCSVLCNGSLCAQTSGACTDGCATEKMFGADCSKICSANCINGTCLKIDGSCFGGCIPGWYGAICSSKCPENCLNETCFMENGTCTLGCVDCFTGPTCSEACPVAAKSKDTVWIYVVIACGAVAAVGILIAIIYTTRKRRRRRKNRPVTVPFDEDDVPNKKSKGRHHVERFSQLFVQNPLAAMRDKIDDKHDETDESQELAVIREKTENNRHETKREPQQRITVENILDHVINMDSRAYAHEFETLQTGLTQKHDASRKLENLAKNFYNGIYPYDNTRVVLKHQTDQVHTDMVTDYINASFIPGYSAEKKYIAAQGPSHVTEKDFWRMVLEQESDLIVMLTVIPDDGYSQCEKYWPEMGEQKQLDDNCVTCLEYTAFADFTIRRFKLAHGDEERPVTHIQFTCWPDHGPPLESADMIECHQKYRSLVKSRECNGPIIVHCTDGVGRTGLFLALDILTDEGLATGDVNVYECVSNLRKQRVKMVLTYEQYEFLYKTIAETLALQCQFMSKADLPEVIEELVTQDNGQSKMETMFKNCVMSMMLDTVDIESISRLEERHLKDRPTSDIPELRYRSMVLSDTYINAVCVDTYMTKNGIIVTQMPIPETVGDFYKLVVDNKCGTIVMLNKIDPLDQTLGVYWPKPDSVIKDGSMQVSMTETEKHDHVVRHLKIEDDQSKENVQASGLVHDVTMFHYTGWEQVHKLPEVRSMLGLIDVVRQHVANSTNKKLLVHCLNGSEQTGLFCVLYNLLEKLDCEDDIGIMSTVRKLKTRRPSAIPDMVQYEYCYEAVLVYMNLSKDYENVIPS